MEWEVLPSFLSNDHHPIFTTVLGHAAPIRLTSPRYNYGKTRWGDFRDDPVWVDLPDVTQFDSTADMVNDLYIRFYIAADHSIRLYVPKRFYPKPYWNTECQRMWKERERVYRKYKASGSPADKIHWKRVRALVKQLLKRTKQTETRNYLSAMKHSVPMPQIYEKLRQMRERPSRKLHILRINGAPVAAVSEIADYIARSFAANSSYDGHTEEFKKHRRMCEKQIINFRGTAEEQYNTQFAQHKLRAALSSAGNTLPGPNLIHYSMLTHLSDDAQL